MLQRQRKQLTKVNINASNYETFNGVEKASKIERRETSKIIEQNINIRTNYEDEYLRPTGSDYIESEKNVKFYQMLKLIIILILLMS